MGNSNLWEARSTIKRRPIEPQSQSLSCGGSNAERLSIALTTRSAGTRRSGSLHHQRCRHVAVWSSCELVHLQESVETKTLTNELDDLKLLDRLHAPAPDP
jgi:hypothetical protein